MYSQAMITHRPSCRVMPMWSIDNENLSPGSMGSFLDHSAPFTLIFPLYLTAILTLKFKFSLTFFLKSLQKALIIFKIQFKFSLKFHKHKNIVKCKIDVSTHRTKNRATYIWIWKKLQKFLEFGWRLTWKSKIKQNEFTWKTWNGI